MVSTCRWLYPCAVLVGDRGKAVKNIPYYTPEVCDGHWCPMDCEDHCPWADEALEKIADENTYDLDEIIAEVRSW